jgi:hypothetical protein
MIQSIYSNEEIDTKERKENSAFKMPKNIRQVGQVDLSKKIYAEDYVMTYIKQLAEKTTVGERKAVLLGQYIKSEGSRHIFINGAVEIIESVDNDKKGTMFSNQAWSEIYDCIKKYFTNVEIVGWYITKKDGPFDVDEHITRMHLDNFSGQDKTLLVYDALEKEEAFYFYDKGKLKKQSGYYIYYDRNEEMQNYMVENKEHVSTDEGYVDLATQKIRKVIESRNDANKQKSMMPLVYTASSLLAVVVLVIGATMVSNYDNMKDTADSMAVLSDGVSNTQAEDESSTGVTQVETVPSSIEKGNNETNVDSENTSVDNADVQAMIEENEAVKGDTETKDNSKDETNDKSNEDSPSKDNSSSDGKKTNTDKTQKESSKEEDNSKKPEESSSQTIAKGNMYTIKKGDTLVSISTRMYGTIKGVDLIKEANNIENQDLIYEGQEIVIPKYK